MAKDPVCGMEVDEQKAAAMTGYKGKPYYFCAPACKATFRNAPEKYVAAERGEKKCCA
ncbi:MAG: YHS domain-containing protein [Anaerolineae bacterium]